eukprot:CAMPEP_0181032250 /NCGR_PEP_ID=MMETSP1070-20121207/6645_1 /TAXON_ID=265543 /ORGANISM="Minutocellus polymorphus, Strain NH13" /LENGTH=675 /DNA_ID=CAMNT_0023109641 /DNA_START=62 /DNA_END=2089 /DNA_ORIENTATION=+
MASSTGIAPLSPTSFRAVATWVALSSALLSTCGNTNTLVSASNMWGGPCESSTSSVPSCMDCCQERKCKNRCVDKCKNKAKKAAEDKEDFCKSYKGQDHYDYSYHHSWYEEELHEHPREDCNSEVRCGLCAGDCDKDSHCKGNLKCKERSGTEHVPGCSGSGKNAWDYCYDPDWNNGGNSGNNLGRCGDDIGYWKPNNCQDFEHCVYDFHLDEFADALGKKAEAYCEDLPVPTPYKPYNHDPVHPIYPGHPVTPLPPTPSPHGSGFANGECDYILDKLSGYKPYKICDEFSYCVEKWEKDSSKSVSSKLAREKANYAYNDCHYCSGTCSDTKDEHAHGQCDSSLGGWKQTCDEYYQCWYDHLKDECSDCIKDQNRNKDRCDDMDACYDDCRNNRGAFEDCLPECDTCYCTYPQHQGKAQNAADKCLSFVESCCQNPYVWLDDDDMRSVVILDRSCTVGNPCGTCRGACSNDQQCTNWDRGANKCALPVSSPTGVWIGWAVEASISVTPINYIPGCKGAPVPGKGYCYNPNKLSSDRNAVIDQCLNQKSASDFGQCCDLPTSHLQCNDPQFSPEGMNYYCSRFNNNENLPITNAPTDRPTNMPIDNGGGQVTCRQIPGVNSIQGSFCGTSYGDICCRCPPGSYPLTDLEWDCSTKGCPNNQGCFQNFQLPCSNVQC